MAGMLQEDDPTVEMNLAKMRYELKEGGGGVPRGLPWGLPWGVPHPWTHSWQVMSYETAGT